MDSVLRRATPLVLLVLAGLAWFEAWLPGHTELAARFGEDAVLRFVLGLLCLYMVMLVIERQRLELAFKQLLAAFKEFHEVTRPGAAASEAPQAKREATEILTAALTSEDSEVRESAAVHLKRLTGQDLGVDPGAWRSWLASQPKER